MSFLIDGLYLGTVTEERNQIINNVIVKTLPFQNTDLAIASNILGKKRIITIQGLNIGANYSTNPYNDGTTVAKRINAFIQYVENWINNGKQSRRDVTDSFGNVYEMICTEFTWIRDQTNPTFLIYSMTLIEGGIS